MNSKVTQGIQMHARYMTKSTIQKIKIYSTKGDHFALSFWQDKKLNNA